MCCFLSYLLTVFSLGLVDYFSYFEVWSDWQLVKAFVLVLCLDFPRSMGMSTLTDSLPSHKSRSGSLGCSGVGWGGVGNYNPTACSAAWSSNLHFYMNLMLCCIFFSSGGGSAQGKTKWKPLLTPWGWSHGRFVIPRVDGNTSGGMSMLSLLNRSCWEEAQTEKASTFINLFVDT